MSEKYSQINRMQMRVIWLMRASVVPVAAWELYRENWNGLLIALAALLFMFSPELVQRWYKFKLPLEYAFVMVFFTFASMILGEFGGAYERFWWWDAVLHASSAIAFSFFGFLFLYVEKLRGRLEIRPFMFGFITFSVGMMVGGVWEIFEFVMDNLFGLNMQRSGLPDTMGDLIVDAIGSLLTAVASVRYVARGGQGTGIASRLLERATERFVEVNHIRANQ